MRQPNICRRRPGLRLIAVASGVLLFAACDSPAPDTAIVDALIAAFNENNLARLDDLIAADVVRHGPPGPPIEMPGAPKGRDIVRADWTSIRSAFPDAVMKLKALTASDDRISVHLSITGTQQGPYFGVLPTGAPVELRVAETYRVANGQVAEIWTIADTLSTIQALTLPVPRPAAMSPLTAEELTTFRPGRFLESIALDEQGTIYVSSMFEAEIIRVSPDGGAEVFASVPVGPPQGFTRGVVCLVFDRDGYLNVNVSSSDPAIHGVWRYDRDGNGRRRAALPPQAFPNGIAIDPDGNLYIADAVHGTIWRVRRDGDFAEPWVVNPLMAARPYVGTLPGANGIKVFDAAVYTVVSDTGRFVRIPILADGSPGLPQVVAEGLPGDDFAFDSEGNAYITTHPFNTVVRLRSDGSREIVASVDQGVVGPTSVAFGTVPGDEQTLYVLNDGGLSNPLPGQALRPNIVKLATSVAGDPIIKSHE
jgi:sugar lactone lactonase YvrE/predicted ester cyclase